LLDAGADETQLAWTPLIRAVALESLADVEREVKTGADLEEKDWWSRTAWLVAIQCGDIARARLLLEGGSDRTSRGRCAKPSLLQAVVALLRAGADVDKEQRGQTALSFSHARDITLRLLEAGADSGQLGFHGRRALCGLHPEKYDAWLEVSPSDFRKTPSRRFGMIRAVISAYEAARLLGETRGDSPLGCAQRFGPSVTMLPDGRIVQIGGEHEDPTTAISASTTMSLCTK
jgi:hypothetical protein